MRRGVRAIALISVVAMCWPIAACGNGATTVPGPAPIATATSTGNPSAPLKAYPDPFTGLRDVDVHLQTAAALLATGLTKAAGTAGDPGGPAADLRATLTYLFTEHVGLVGLVAQAVNHSGPETEATKAALKALAANSAALSAKLSSVTHAAPTASPAPTASSASDSSDLTSSDFMTAWSAHNDELFNYVVAAKEKVDNDQNAARKRLGRWRQAAGSSLKNAANGKLRSTTVRDTLDKYLSAMLDAVDSLARQDGKGYDNLRVAAGAITDTAAVLADGFARSAGLGGHSNDDASTARANQTYLLTEHADLTAAVVYAAYSNLVDGGVASADAKAARAALDANAKDLAGSFGKAVGARDQALFLEDWRRGILGLLDYATAVAASNASARDKAVVALAGYRTSITGFFVGISGSELSTAQVGAEMADHITRLTADIGAFASLAPPSAT